MKNRLLLITLLFLSLAPLSDASQKGIWPFRKKAKAAVEQKDTTRKEDKYEKFFRKESKKQEGFLTVHLKEGKVYFEIDDSLLGRDLVMGTTIRSISDNENGVVGAKNELTSITFTKADSTIQLRELSYDCLPDTRLMQEALSRSHTGTILANMPIVQRGPDSTYVFDMTGFFLSGHERFSPFLDISANKSMYNVKESFKKSLSFIEDVKAFEDNASVTMSLSYTYSMTDIEGREVRKNVPLTAEMTCSMLLLPEEPYHPRVADPRIGYFWTCRQLFGSQTESSRPVYLTNRWRLEPSDTAAFRRGEKVEPVKPIVFYVDSTFPDWWKPYVRNAVNQWSKVFEEIGFRNAVQAKDFPDDDPEFDPDNIKYSCIRYAPVGIQNAMGPSWVDPRSGEIITASVYVYHDIIRLLTDWMFVQTAQADDQVRTRYIPQELMGDAIEYVIRHEVGHTLGLMHNMSGSYVIPVEDLRDPEASHRHGTTTSIMDYARFNYVAQPGDKERGVKLTPPEFGAYDRWAIRWGYQPVFDADNLQEEARITSGWITDSLTRAPYYRYGIQQVYGILFDPRCQVEDLGDDVLKATRYGVSNLKYIMENFMDWIADEDDPECEFRQEILTAILNQYLRYYTHVINNVGGLYRNEVIAGDGNKRFENIPGDRQRELLDYAFRMMEDVSWLDNPAVLGRLPMVGKPSSAVRRAMESRFVNVPFLCDKSDGISTEEFGTAESLDAVFGYVWKPTLQGRKLSAEQRTMEKNYIDHMIAMAGFRKSSSGGKSFADLHQERSCCMLEDLQGEIAYSEISGFEWLPRSVMNLGDFSASSVYAVLKRAMDLMKSRKASASSEDKAHYELMIKKIEFAL